MLQCLTLLHVATWIPRSSLEARLTVGPLATHKSAARVLVLGQQPDALTAALSSAVPKAAVATARLQLNP
jgi:hypothetical protein